MGTWDVEESTGRRHCEPKTGDKKFWVYYGVGGVTVLPGGFGDMEETKLRWVFIGKCLKEASQRTFPVLELPYGASPHNAKAFPKF